jgi:hypothetical protein
MSARDAWIAVGGVGAVLAWLATFRLLGGKYLFRYPYLITTWPTMWRALVASGVGLAVLAIAAMFARGLWSLG